MNNLTNYQRYPNSNSKKVNIKTKKIIVSNSNSNSNSSDEEKDKSNNKNKMTKTTEIISKKSIYYNNRSYRGRKVVHTSIIKKYVNKNEDETLKHIKINNNSKLENNENDKLLKKMNNQNSLVSNNNNKSNISSNINTSNYANSIKTKNLSSDSIDISQSNDGRFYLNNHKNNINDYFMKKNNVSFNDSEDKNKDSELKTKINKNNLVESTTNNHTQSNSINNNKINKNKKNNYENGNDNNSNVIININNNINQFKIYNIDSKNENYSNRVKSSDRSQPYNIFINSNFKDEKDYKNDLHNVIDNIINQKFGKNVNPKIRNNNKISKSKNKDIIQNVKETKKVNEHKINNIKTAETLKNNENEQKTVAAFDLKIDDDANKKIIKSKNNIDKLTDNEDPKAKLNNNEDSQVKFKKLDLNKINLGVKTQINSMESSEFDVSKKQHGSNAITSDKNKDSYIINETMKNNDSYSISKKSENVKTPKNDNLKKVNSKSQNKVRFNKVFIERDNNLLGLRNEIFDENNNNSQSNNLNTCSDSDKSNKSDSMNIYTNRLSKDDNLFNFSRDSLNSISSQKSLYLNDKYLKLIKKYVPYDKKLPKIRLSDNKKHLPSLLLKVDDINCLKENELGIINLTPKQKNRSSINHNNYDHTSSEEDSVENKLDLMMIKKRSNLVISNYKLLKNFNKQYKDLEDINKIKLSSKKLQKVKGNIRRTNKFEDKGVDLHVKKGNDYEQDIIFGNVRRIKSHICDLESKSSALTWIKIIDSIIFFLIIINLILGSVDMYYLSKYEIEKTQILNIPSIIQENQYIEKQNDRMYLVNFTKCFKEKKINLFLKILQFIVVFVIYIFVVLRYKYKVQRMILTNKVTIYFSFFSFKVLKSMIIEMLFLSIFAYPKTDIELISVINEVEIKYSLSCILYIISLFKVVYLFRIFGHYSMFNQTWIKIFAKSLKRAINVKYALKAQLITAPLTTIFTVYGIIWLVMSMIVFTFESTDALIINSNTNEIGSKFNKTEMDIIIKKNPLSNLSESLWFIIVTMTTLGYGDMILDSFGGKIFSLIAGTLGMLMFSLGIAFIGQYIAFDQNQNTVYMIKTNDELVKLKNSKARDLIYCLLQLNQIKREAFNMNKNLEYNDLSANNQLSVNKKEINKIFESYMKIIVNLKNVSLEFSRISIQSSIYKPPLIKTLDFLDKKSKEDKEFFSKIQKQVHVIRLKSEEIKSNDEIIGNQFKNIKNCISYLEKIMIIENQLK